MSAPEVRILQAVQEALAAAKAEGAREALAGIANLFYEQYHDAPCADIGKSEVQAFLDDKARRGQAPRP